MTMFEVERQSRSLLSTRRIKWLWRFIYLSA